MTPSHFRHEQSADAPEPTAGPRLPAAPSGASELDLAALPSEPRRRLSTLRVLAAAALTLALPGVSALALALPAGAPAARRAPTWFAPYADATLTPAYEFQDPSVNPSATTLLSFIVADPTSPCTPSWGGYYTLRQAAGSPMDLARRIAQARSQGASIAVSFGGEDNSELADACDNVTELGAAYQSVVARYSLKAADFDIEGAAQTDTAANARRALALAALQRRQHARGSQLAVWLTVPVATDGLQQPAIGVIRQTLRGGVQLSGVNIMAFDYGPSAKASASMPAAIESSAEHAVSQIRALYGQSGHDLSDSAAWAHLGVTVEIGQSDEPGQRLTLAGAAQIAAWASANHLGRLSEWSLNRDQPCDASYLNVEVYSDSCSGVAQTSSQFAGIFAGAPGALRALISAPSVTLDTPAVSDDPASSPYPIWNPASGYEAGYKVVWQRQVWQARWYTVAQEPAGAADGASPWQLLGPVLPGERAPALPRLPAGTYPRWSEQREYRAGARVLYDGLPYVAK